MRVVAAVIGFALLASAAVADTWPTDTSIGSEVTGQNRAVDNLGTVDLPATSTFQVWISRNRDFTVNPGIMGTGWSGNCDRCLWYNTSEQVLGRADNTPDLTLTSSRSPVAAQGELISVHFSTSADGGTNYLFENGIQYASTTQDAEDSASDSFDLYSRDQGNYEMEGRLTSARIYSTQVPSDIAQTIHLQKGRDRYLSGLVSWWHPTPGAAPGVSTVIGSFADRFGPNSSGSFQGAAPVAGHLLPQIRRRSARY